MMKRSLKKRLAVAIAGLMLIPLLVGCGGGGGASNETENGSATTVSPEEETAAVISDLSGTLSILSWHNETTMQPVMDRFKELHPNVEFDFIFAPPVADYIQMFRMMATTDTLPDVFITAMENRFEVIDEGLAMDLSSLPIFDRLPASNIDPYSHDGDIYAFAADAWIAGIFYNRDILRANDIEVPTNLEEYVAAMDTLRNNGVQPWVFHADNMYDPLIGFVATETVEQDSDFDQKVNEGELSFADGWSDAIALWEKHYIEPGNINVDAMGLTGDQATEMFAFEEAAFAMGATWTVGTIEELNPDFEFGMLPWFGTDGETEWLAGAAGVGWSINSTAENPDAAWAFLEFMTSDEGLQLFQGLTGSLLAIDGIDFPVHPVFADMLHIMQEGRIYLPRANWTFSDAIGNEMEVAVQEVILGNIAPEQIMTNMDNIRNELEAANQ